MAAKTQEPKSGGGKGKITVVMFQLEGSDETLRDAIKALGQGIDKLAPGVSSYRLTQAATQGKSHGALVASSETPEVFEPEILDPEEETPEDEGGATSSTERQKQKRKPPKAIEPVKGIDWESGTSWKEYAKQKNPEGNTSRFVVAAGWFRNIRSISVITPGHIVAAFDVMDWQKPESIPNTFSQLKHKRANELFDKGEKANEWVLSQRGINALDRLGKEKAN